MNSNIQKLTDDDYNNFTKQLELIDSSKATNILDQLPSYNSNDTSLFINDLRTELDQQKTLNLMLENKDYKKNIESIKKFTDLNSGKVEKQLNEIKKVSNSLQKLIIKNDQLKKDNQELLESSEGEEFKNLAKNMREIKREKENIKNFLKNLGIISPPLIL